MKSSNKIVKTRDAHKGAEEQEQDVLVSMGISGAINLRRKVGSALQQLHRF